MISCELLPEKGINLHSVSTHRNTDVIATYTSICSVEAGDGNSLFLGHVDHCKAVEAVSGTGEPRAGRQGKLIELIIQVSLTPSLIHRNK